MKLYDKLRGFVGKGFYQWGNYIGIYPTPTETKRIGIHYVKTPSTLVVGNHPIATPQIGEEYHEALVYYAVKEIAMRINPELSQMYELKWREILTKASEGSKKVYPERTKAPYRDF